MAEITSPDYPGERLVVCKNPLLAGERTRKRDELLAATEKDLARIQARVQRASNPLRGAAAIGAAVGAVFGRRKMAKHFDISITDDSFGFTRNNAAIAAEAALDGIYVVRTNLPPAQSDAAATVRAYKSLAGVEHAFRSMKTVDLELRPVFHWTAPRVRAHVLLCMLAYYLEWHMRQRLAPILFDEHDPLGRDAQRTSPVAKARPSPAARYKAASKHTDPAHGEPLPVHSFRTLLADLATLTRNIVQLGKHRLNILLAAPTKVVFGEHEDPWGVRRRVGQEATTWSDETTAETVRRGGIVAGHPRDPDALQYNPTPQVSRGTPVARTGKGARDDDRFLAKCLSHLSD